MATRLEVWPTIFDARANKRLEQLLDHGFSGVADLWISDVYTLDKPLTSAQLNQVSAMLANPVIETVVNADARAKGKPFSWAIEVGFLPGVTDNVASTAQEAIEDLLKIAFISDEAVYTSQMTFIAGDISESDAKKIAGTLANPLIQRIQIKKFARYQKDGGMGVAVPRVQLGDTPAVTEVDLTVSDEQLQVIGKTGIENSDGSRRGPLALDLAYMKTIQAHFKSLRRNPTDIELESIAQTWSEHCKHTIFADPLDDIDEGIFKHFIKRATVEIRANLGKADFCASVFTDNSGAIEFDEDYLITHKVETHNSPSALDPFGGAITGIVGVNRDTIGFGMGAKPVINIYGFCLADPKDETALFRDKALTQPMLPASRIMQGVIAGVNSGGNQSGIPTPQGWLFFNDRYRGKPLVFAGTVGLIPKKIGGAPSVEKQARPGDLIVMIGGRVGQDGIHGATFSSEALDSGSPAAAVQIGDPITQKKFSDAIVKEARDQGLYTSITDDGAGGLSCSVAEMAKESGGCLVELEQVPLKYPGLAPWQIWISESQERMTLAVSSDQWPKLSKLMVRRGVEATVIGKFTDSGRCIVKYQNNTIMDLELDFLHDGLPSRPLTGQAPKQSTPENLPPAPKDLAQILKKMVASINIASTEFVSSQYDYEVQGGSTLKPVQGRGRVNAEASVTRPLPRSVKGVVLSQALYPSYSEIDSYNMAAAGIDTAFRNIVSAGADPDRIALLDNFCWSSPNQPERLHQLKRAAQACYDYAVAYRAPYISGKDSMHNDFKGYDATGQAINISIPPTLLISSIGTINDSYKAVSLDAKMAGDLVYILGDTNTELGGSEYYDLLNQEATQSYFSPSVPTVDAVTNLKLYRALAKAINRQLVASATSVTRGGLAVALAKTAMGGLLGIDISLGELPGKADRDDLALFSESQGRILVTIDPKQKAQFEQTMSGNVFKKIGHVTNNQAFNITGISGQKVAEIKIAELLSQYRSTLGSY